MTGKTINCLKSSENGGRGRNGEFHIKTIQIGQQAWGGKPCVMVSAYSAKPCRTAPVNLTLEADVAKHVGNGILECAGVKQPCEFCNVVVVNTAEANVVETDLIIGADNSAVAKRAEEVAVQHVRQYCRSILIDDPEVREAFLDNGYVEDGCIAVFLTWPHVTEVP